MIDRGVERSVVAGVRAVAGVRRDDRAAEEEGPRGVALRAGEVHEGAAEVRLGVADHGVGRGQGGQGVRGRTDPRHAQDEVGLDRAAHAVHVVGDLHQVGALGQHQVRDSSNRAENLDPAEVGEEVRDREAECAGRSARDQRAGCCEGEVRSSHRDHSAVGQGDAVADCAVRRRREHNVLASCLDRNCCLGVRHRTYVVLGIGDHRVLSAAGRHAGHGTDRGYGLGLIRVHNREGY